jgi:hypothetical protein
MPEIDSRLHEWGIWTRIDALPRLDVPEPSIFRMWIPSRAWDSGWGEQGAPEESPSSINDRRAQETDHGIMRLVLIHRTVIKRHYACDWRQQPDQLAEAKRHLCDILHLPIDTTPMQVY